jgi:hypothetical protein
VLFLKRYKIGVKNKKGGTFKGAFIDWCCEKPVKKICITDNVVYFRPNGEKCDFYIRTVGNWQVLRIYLKQFCSDYKTNLKTSENTPTK